MAEGYAIDLTYITERIIAISFPRACPEETYVQNLRDITVMLKSKHGPNYTVINLSEKNEHLTQMNPKVLNPGWPHLLAPSLDQMCSVCSTMETWLQTHPQHVLVLHCRGGRDRIGVVVASYIHFTNISASGELGLDHFAMRRFYNNKVSLFMTPSQKRYVWMLSGLLRGVMKMIPSPLFLLCVVLHGVPRLSPTGGCRLFLRVYQSLQAVCTSAIYHVPGPQTDRIYFVLQPAQLLKGDIMVVCYHKSPHTASRQVIFRLQFHTGVIHGHTLVLPKEDLDCASGGGVPWQNDPSVTVDYDTLDPVVRRDSFEHISDQEAAHNQGPVDGSLYARVRKRSGEEGASLPAPAASPVHSDLALSASSDSGFSVASQWTNSAVAASSRREPLQHERTPPKRLVFGVGLEPAGPPPEGMTELPTSDGGGGGRVEGVGGADQTVNERETDILDDNYDERRGGEASPALDRHSSASIGSLSSESLPDALGLVQSEYSTHTWVHQQQMVDTHPHAYPSSEGQGGVDGGRGNAVETPPPPNTPLRGNSSRKAVQRGAEPEGSPDRTDGAPQTDTRATANAADSSLSGEPSKEEELASLACDMDESIEQLNQLILDLDPTFVPVPTRCAPLSRSTSLYTNGINHRGPAHQSGWQSSRQSRQSVDVRDYPRLHSPEWGGAVTFRDSPVFNLEPAPSQRGGLFGVASVDYSGSTPVAGDCDVVPSTPGFPVSPPTPYVKSFAEFSHLRPSGQWEPHGTSLDSRSFLDSMSHSAGSTEGDLFRSEVSSPPSSYQRMFHGSLLSNSSGSPLPHPDCSTPPPVWLERTPSSPGSPFLLRPSTPLSLSSPDAHSSPRGGPARALVGRGDADVEGDLSSLGLGNGSLERSLLEAVEGLGGLGLGLGLGEGGLLPLLPLLPGKRRGGEGGELHLHSGSRSPSLSGFSSPHSGSSLSIPFPSAASADYHRGPSGASSPGADLFASKQDTVKFVQDTSKFWYKPDISRDQAIAVLKDKEPGSFIVRDSHSFRGAYGLAMKVSTPPPSVVQQSKKVGDLSNELVRHFLIECSQKGVRLKGCPNEPYFGSLTALVCQHSITPLALPCKLIIPDGDPLEDMTDSSPQSASNSAAELLKQGAACNVWYLGSVELESLTGHQAVQKAATISLAMEPPPTSTVVHFKVSAQGITLTDNQRKLFFRRHYTVNMVIFCSLDPQDRRWTKDGSSSAKIFGFVARKTGSVTENVCHLFAEHDPEQPASAIVNFVSKVMIGSQKNK